MLRTLQNVPWSVRNVLFIPSKSRRGSGAGSADEFAVLLRKRLSQQRRAQVPRHRRKPAAPDCGTAPAAGTLRAADPAGQPPSVPPPRGRARRPGEQRLPRAAATLRDDPHLHALLVHCLRLPAGASATLRVRGLRCEAPARGRQVSCAHLSRLPQQCHLRAPCRQVPRRLPPFRHF